MLARTISLYQNAYSGLSRSTWLLSLVMLVNRSGTMVLPFMTIYLTQPSVGYSIGQAGIVMGIFGFGAVCGGFIGGRLTDRFGFQRIQWVTLAGGGLLFMVLGQMKSYPLICVCTFLLSLVNEAFRPANSTAIAHYSKEENRTRSYSLNRLAVNLGWAVGGALGGFLASINYHLLFWVDGCTNILAALLLLKLMPRSKVAKTINIPEETETRASAYKDKEYLLFILLATLFSMCFFQFFIMQPVFYKIQWHFNESLIGFLLALNGVLIAVVEMVLIHNLEGKRNILIYISTGILMGAVGFVSLNLVPPTAIAAILIVVLITFSEMLCMPFMNSFWIYRTTIHNRGEYAALYSMSWSASQVIAPFVGGYVISYGGFTLLWWVLGVVSLISSAGYASLYWFNYRHKETANFDA